MPSFGLAHPRGRFPFERLTAEGLARIARFPSYRAPRAADLHDPATFQPPTEPSDEPVMSGRAFIAFGSSRPDVRLVAVQPFMGELAASPHLATLRRLDLTGNRIGPEGAQALAASPYLGGLRELGLNGNAIGPEGAAALAVAPWLAGVERLEVADNGLTAGDVRRMLDAAPRVTAVDVSGNEAQLGRLLRARMREVVAAGVNRQLEGVRAGQPNPPGPPSLRGKGGDAPTDLPGIIPASAVSQEAEPTGHPLPPWGRGPGGGVDPVRTPASYPNFRSPEHTHALETLDLRHTHFPLCEFGPFPALLHLNLGFSDPGAAFDPAAFPAVRTLGLRACRLTNPVLPASIEALDLSVNPLADPAASLARCPRLHHLDLANTGLSDAALSRVLAAVPQLRSLNLAWNPITDTAALLDHPSLQAVDVCGTRVGRRGLKALAARFGTIRG